MKSDGRMQFVVRFLALPVCEDDMYFITKHFGEVICFQGQYPFHAARVVEGGDAVGYFHVYQNIVCY